MSTSPKIKLVYFDIEGVAEQVRLALTLSGIEFEDERVAFPQWQEMKPTTPYGSLPIMYVDDETEPRTQSGAMVRYVANLKPEVGLYPADKLYVIEEAMGLLGDLTRAWSPSLYLSMRPQNFGYPEGFNQTDEGKLKIKEMREKFLAEHLPTFLQYIADFIDKHGGGQFLCGDKPTIADCLAVPTLRNFTRGHIDHVPSNCLEIEPRIVDYVKRFCSLPEIKGRYTSGLTE